MPDAITVKFLPIDDVPNTRFAPLVMLASLAPLLFKLTAPVKALVCVSVIGLDEAEKLDVPDTVNIPVCVIAPIAETVKFLPMDEAPNTNAVPFVTLASFAPPLFKVTAPVNALVCVKVIEPDDVAKLEVPGTVNGPVCVTVVVALIVKLFPTEDVPKTRPSLLVKLTSLRPLLFNDTAPIKILF